MTPRRGEGTDDLSMGRLVGSVKGGPRTLHSGPRWSRYPIWMGSRSLPKFPTVTAQPQWLDAHPRVFISSCCAASLLGVHLVMSTPPIRCVWPCAWPDKVEIRQHGICCCCRHSLHLFQAHSTLRKGTFFSEIRAVWRKPLSFLFGSPY